MREKFSRYIFTFLDAVDAPALTKLCTICDKIFIFLPKNTQSIPVSLVSIAQKKGKNLKWIPSPHDNPMQSALSFSLGVWHERSPLDIEFVVASNEESLDPFIDFMNAIGRKCLRVRVNDSININRIQNPYTESKIGFQTNHLSEVPKITIQDLEFISPEK